MATRKAIEKRRRAKAAQRKQDIHSFFLGVAASLAATVIAKLLGL